MMSLGQDLRYSLRRLRKDPAFAAIAVLVLAVGIGASTAVFSILDPLVLDPLPFENPSSLYRIYGTDDYYDWDRSPLTWLDFLDLDEQAQGFEATALRGRGFNLVGGDQTLRVKGLEVSASFFSLFDVNALRGRTFSSAEERSKQRLAMLSESFWKSQMGSSSLAGLTIDLDGSAYEVVGVIPAEFQVLSRDAAIWVPLDLSEEERNNRQLESLTVIARLHPDSGQEEVAEELKSIAGRLAAAYPGSNEHRGFRLLSLYQEIYGEDFHLVAMIFILAVLAVHLIAVFNISSMLLARAVDQQQEFALRTSLGAGRGELIRLSLSEALMLCVMGGVLGLVFGSWGTQYLQSVVPADIPRLENVVMDGRILLFTVLLSLSAGAFFGLAPVLLLRSPNLAGLVKEQDSRSQGSRRKKWLRRAFVVAEMTMSFVLLVAALLLIRSFQYLQTTYPGFEAEGILTFKTSMSDAARLQSPEDRREVLSRRYESILDSVGVLPGVEGFAFADAMPGESAAAIRYAVAGRELPQAGREPIADFLTVSPDYFSVLRAPIVNGRPIEAQDSFAGERAVVVNQSLARLSFGGKDPLLLQLTLGGDSWRVVGVVADFQQGGLEDPVLPTIFFSYQQRTEVPTDMTFAVRSMSGDPMSLATAVQAAVAGAQAGIPIYEVKALEEILQDDIAGTGIMAQLLGRFALVAVILALAGIYGVMSYSVSLRRHEMGVRMAFGASRRDVVSLVFREGAWLAVMGVVFGVFGALAVTRLLKGWIHGISALDGPAFFLGAVLLLAMGILASFLPARRVARLKPTLLLDEK